MKYKNRKLLCNQYHYLIHVAFISKFLNMKTSAYFLLSCFLVINQLQVSQAQQSETRYASEVAFGNTANWQGHNNALGTQTGNCLVGSQRGGWVEFRFGNFSVVGEVLGIEIRLKYLSQSSANDISLKYNGAIMATKRLDRKEGVSNCNGTWPGSEDGATDAWGTALFPGDFNDNDVVVRIDSHLLYTSFFRNNGVSHPLDV